MNFMFFFLLSMGARTVKVDVNELKPMPISFLSMMLISVSFLEDPLILKSTSHTQLLLRFKFFPCHILHLYLAGLCIVAITIQYFWEMCFFLVCDCLGDFA